MNILCWMFGHKSLEHVYSGGEYMRQRVGATDGIGRVHVTLTAHCPRCGVWHRAGQIHLLSQSDIDNK